MFGFTIVVDYGEGVKFYLNHSQLNSKSFGSEEMAWITPSPFEAKDMLERCQETLPQLADIMSIEKSAL